MIILSGDKGVGLHHEGYVVYSSSSRYSILPAISLDGVLHLDILTRSWTAEEFREYISALLDRMNPYPQKNSVLIMDNASVHHFDGLREMVEERYALRGFFLSISSTQSEKGV